MADTTDTTRPERMPIPWFDDPAIAADLTLATIAAEDVARAKGAEPRDLMFFHLQQAAGHAGCEVWELFDKLKPSAALAKSNV